MDLQCYRAVIDTFACKLPFILARKAARLHAKSPKLAKATGKAKGKSSRRLWSASASGSGLNHDVGDGGIVFTILLVFAAGVLMFTSPRHTHSI